ncbi:MAG TPA: serine/threonine protein kinase, partial [Rhodocyclaceae bacterium]|nr:serine/threonine protein kinase [Rhodocyclaceae bacterium]
GPGPAPAAATASSPAPAEPIRKGGVPTLAVAGVVGVLVVAGGAWMMLGKGKESAVPVAPAAVAPAPAAPTADPLPAPGGDSIVITAVGLADPSDPRYQQDKGLMQADLREDAKRQLIEKAAALYVSQASLDQNYPLLQAKLLSRSAEFIKTLSDEGTPRVGKDGLATLAAKATIDVRQVQKSLNQMSRDERVDFIRNNGDPKISVAITAKSAEGDPSVAAPRSPVAENLLKERIQSFGFRLWADEGKSGADFAVTGEARFKKLSAKLEASGITIEKYVLTSWTVKCTDRRTGEEIYYNTQIPEKTSWATEEQALKEIGKLIGEEFSKNFFLQHFHFAAQPVKLRFQGLPGKDTADALLRELQGMRGVVSVQPAGGGGTDAAFDAQLSGGMVAPSELVQGNLVALLNRKLGRTCFSVSGSAGTEVTMAFEKSCGEPAVLGRLDALPPAALMAAPPTRRDAIVKNPDTLKKLSI